MKTIMYLCCVFALFFFTGCSSDDEDMSIDGLVEENNSMSLSPTETSIVGYWQLVQHSGTSGDMVDCINNVNVIEFKDDRSYVVYQEGKEISRSQFWLMPLNDSDSFDLLHQPKHNESSTRLTLSVYGDYIMITMNSCFTFYRNIYKRIASLTDTDSTIKNYQYERRPTSIEGKWHMLEIRKGYEISKFLTPGDYIVSFGPNKTIEVQNSVETQADMTFLPSGIYSYETDENEASKYDKCVFADINIMDKGKCTCLFIDDLMILDYDQASGGPGYCFRKIWSFD